MNVDNDGLSKLARKYRILSTLQHLIGWQYKFSHQRSLNLPPAFQIYFSSQIFMQLSGGSTNKILDMHLSISVHFLHFYAIFGELWQ